MKPMKDGLFTKLRNARMYPGPTAAYKHIPIENPGSSYLRDLLKAKKPEFLSLADKGDLRISIMSGGMIGGSPLWLIHTAGEYIPSKNSNEGQNIRRDPKKYNFIIIPFDIDTSNITYSAIAYPMHPLIKAGKNLLALGASSKVPGFADITSKEMIRLLDDNAKLRKFYQNGLKKRDMAPNSIDAKVAYGGGLPKDKFGSILVTYNIGVMHFACPNVVKLQEFLLKRELIRADEYNRAMESKNSDIGDRKGHRVKLNNVNALFQAAYPGYPSYEGYLLYYHGALHSKYHPLILMAGAKIILMVIPGKLNLPFEEKHKSMIAEGEMRTSFFLSKPYYLKAAKELFSKYQVSESEDNFSEVFAKAIAYVRMS